MAILVVIGGVMASVLAIGLKVLGLNPGRRRWILSAIKLAADLPLEGKQSRRPHVVCFYDMLKNPSKHKQKG
jgi:hypothetical protein